MPRLTSNKAQGILESLGISLVDDQNNMRDVMQIYTEVSEKIKGISDVSRMEVYEGLAGKYHISRLTALLDDLGSVDSMYKSMYESSTNSTGSAMDENEKFMKSLQARINLARVEVEKLALAFGDAFLTEGMIQGIKVFGDFLSVIAKLTETFGALPMVLGIAGAGVALLSTNFRNLMISIGTSGIKFAKFAAQSTQAAAAPLPAIMTQATAWRNLTATTALTTTATRNLVSANAGYSVSSANTAKTTATQVLANNQLTASFASLSAASRTAIQANGQLATAINMGHVTKDKATASTRALTASTVQLTAAQRAQGQAAVNAAMETNASAAANTAAGTSARTAAAGFWAASASMRSMLLSAGAIGAAFIAVGFVTEKLMSKTQKQRELQEEIKTENKALIDSYSKNKDAVSTLAAEYGNLETAMQQDNSSTENRKRYLEVSNELAGLMPHLVQGEDSYGNKVLGNSDIIQSRIEMIKAQVEAEQALLDVQNQQDTDAKIAEMEKLATTQAKTAEAYMANFKDQATNSLFTSNAYKPEEEIQSLKDMEAAMVHFNSVKKRLAEEGRTNTPEGNEVQDTIDDLTADLDKYRQATLQVDTAQAYLTSQYAVNMDKRVAANKNLSDSTKAMASNIVYDLALISQNSSEVQPIANLFANMEGNADLENALGDLDSSIQDLRENAETDFSKIEESADKSLSKMKSSIMGASGLQIDTPEWNSLSSGLDSYINNLMAQEKATRDSAAASGQSVEETRAAAAAFDEAGDSALDEAEDVYALKDAIDLMSGVNQQMITDSDELIWMIQNQTGVLASLTEGTYAHSDAEATLASMKEQLISLYPHLFEADATSIALTDDKISAVAAEVEANDILRAAYSASRDGKLTSEQEATLANLANTNARIKNINAEITALNKLAQAYRAFASSSIETANELAKTGLDADAEDAYIRAQKFNGFAMTQEKASAGLQAELANETAARTSLTNIMKNVPEVMDRGTTAANKNANAARKGADAAKKGAGAKDKQTKAEKDAAKANEESYKTITENNEAIEKAIFITNEYEKAIEKLTLAIQKQESITQKFPTYSREYQASLKKEIKLQEEKQKVLEKQAKSLEGQIKSGNIIRYGTNTVVTQPSSTTTKTVRELAGWDGAITSGYGMRRHPTTGKYAMHDGIDIDGKTGDRLDANINGKVLWAGDKGNGLGKYVMIQAENGIKHIFGHLSKVAVKIGDNVATGMKLGEIGSTGRSTGSHLHYEVRNQNNKSVNPLSYLNNAKGGKTVYSETTTDSKSSSSSAGYVGKYAKEINAASKSFGVSADLIAAMIKQESNFNSRAVSGAGAKGLMQLMPGTARELGVKDPFNVQQNINGGTKYIAQQLKAFGGDVKKALAAYNAGAGNVRKYGGIPPFKETQNYVKKVMANFTSYSGKAATSNTVTDTTTTAGTSVTSVFKDEAATKEAIEQAESQIIDINGELISVKDHIQQLQMDIVNGQLSYYQDQRERQDRSIAHIEKDIALLDSTSIHYTKTLDDMYKHMAEKQRLNKEEVRYLEKMANSNTLNAAATEELRLKAADLKLEIKDLNLAMSELAMNGFSAHMGRFGERIDDLEYLIEISKAYSSTLSESDPKRGIELGKQVHLMEHQQDLLKRQQVRAEKMLKNTSLTADQHKEIEKTLQGINAEYWSLEQQIREVNAGIADDVIAQMKEVYTKQKEMNLKAIEEERTAYQKLINDKMDMLDEQAEKEDFLADQKDKQQEMTELQSKIDLLSLDDSQFAKAEKAKLQKELDALDKDYAKFMKDKEREDRRESLEEELENKEEELDKKTEVTETYWDNIINNERKFAKDRENIMKGETTKYVLELERLAKWTEKHSKDMGKAISENIVDNLKEANNLLKNVSPVNDSDKSLANRNKKDGDSVKWESTYRKEDEKKNSKKRKTKSALNLRSGAGVNNKSLVVIPKGKTVEYLDVKTKGWAKVKYDGKTGYVDAKHLQHLETGGYTGDNVPKDGALAVLHKKEQVLNKDDTSNLFKTIDLMNRIHSKMKSFIPPALSGNSSNGNTQIENLVHIENFNGTKKEVDSLASNLISSLGKKGVIITR